MSDKIDTSPEAVDPRCAKCGHKRSEHHYRHPFVGPTQADTTAALSARVAELEAKNRELALEVISADGQAAEAYEKQLDLQAKLGGAQDTLAKMAEGWANALELNIIAPQHRTSACILRDEARDTFAELKGETND